MWSIHTSSPHITCEGKDLYKDVNDPSDARFPAVAGVRQREGDMFKAPVPPADYLFPVSETNFEAVTVEPRSPVDDENK